MKTSATKTDSQREASASHADANRTASRGGIGLAGRAPAMLTIGYAGEAAEREADMLTAQMLAGSSVRATRHAPPVSRKCATCEEDEKGIVRRKCAACEEEAKVRRNSAPGGDVHGGQSAPPSVANLMAQPGRALDPSTRGFFENRLGVELGGVRVHDSGAADAAARAIGARAFTVGNHIAFARGAYQPQSQAGVSLLGHELVHVAQNRGDAATVRRLCTHDGTPTNCHNWLLPLPPWTAGSIAHQQVSVWAGMPPGTIPRGTKAWPRGLPTTSFTPPGFADLWNNAATQVEIGEIKSTQTGSVVAAAEATHYMTRHAEWLGRLGAPPLDRQDSLYLGLVGSPKLPFPLNLGSRTGSGIPIGPFAGDPGKILNVEADAAGAVVYWCTGPGLVNPLWLLAFKAALDALRRQFQALKRQIERMIDGLIEGIGAAARWISENIGTILLVLLAILLVVLIIVFWVEILALLAAAAAAVAAAAAEITAVVGLAAAAAGILLLLGIDIPQFAPATRAVASALRPDAADTTVTGASYDPPTNRAPSSATATALLAGVADPGAQVLAALSPIADSDTLINAATAVARGNVNEAQLRAAMRRGVTALVNAGDANGAELMQRRLRDAGIG
jgi:hypothetical protein